MMKPNIHALMALAAVASLREVRSEGLNTQGVSNGVVRPPEPLKYKVSDSKASDWSVKKKKRKKR